MGKRVRDSAPAPGVSAAALARPAPLGAQPGRGAGDGLCRHHHPAPPQEITLRK